MFKKFILSIIAPMVIASPSLAAKINDARLNLDTGNLELYVTYKGCLDDDFDLKVDICSEIYPVLCDLTLIHDSNGETCPAS